MTKKKFGQHFLTDLSVAQREIRYAEVTQDDTVLEIGPGRGILTKLLAEKAKQVIAIEIDEQLVAYLQTIMPKNVQIIQGDAVKLDFHMFPRFTKVVANLPFQISSAITFKLLNYDFSKAVLMYQKEFAERMVAKPGSKNYSRLSVAIYYKTTCRQVEIVSKKCFFPRPKVDSSIVILTPRKTPPFPVENESFFFTLTRELFNHRRKKIKHVLRYLFEELSEEIPYQNMRVEQLTPEEIAGLSNLLITKYGNNLPLKH